MTGPFRIIKTFLMVTIFVSLNAFVTASAEEIQDQFNINTPDGELITLIADQIDYDADSQVVVASGNVVAHYGGRTLNAQEIIYNANEDRLGAAGAIAIKNIDGSYLFANSAELDGTLKNGLIKGARALLANGGRIASVEGRRVDGVFTAFTKAVFSPCKVCEEDPTPLWRIRADKVVHDSNRQDIVYENARFDLMGQPIGFLPFFRHPDPTVKRRSGWLAPEFLSSSVLGPSIKTPYYYVINDFSDATIKPFISSKEGLVLEGEYRQRLKSGGFQANSSLTYAQDDAGDEEVRGHIFSDGQFDLGTYANRPWNWGFDVNLATDDSYLRRYEISNEDRLTSNAYISSYTDKGFVAANAYYFQSFREDEPSDQIPVAFPEVEIEQHWKTPKIGGRLTARGGILHLNRDEGRDVSRLTAGLEWGRGFTLSNGVLFNTFASVRADSYWVENDPISGDDTYNRILPMAGIDIRYPFFKDNGETTHIIEPIVQGIFATYGGNPSGIPNEDSIDIELDETTLFSGNRFPGLDRWEEGPRVSVGVRYERESTDKLSIDASFGQSFRFRESNDFTTASSLNDQQSDYVGAYTLAYDKQHSLTHRFRLDTENFSFNRNEVYLNTSWDRISLSGGYIFLRADPEQGVLDDRTELNGVARLSITDNWSLNSNMRRDLTSDRFVTLGGGLEYQDECIAVDFSVKRRLNSVPGAPSTLSFGLTVRLLGL